MGVTIKCPGNRGFMHFCYFVSIMSYYVIWRLIVGWTKSTLERTQEQIGGVKLEQQLKFQRTEVGSFRNSRLHDIKVLLLIHWRITICLHEIFKTYYSFLDLVNDSFLKVPENQLRTGSSKVVLVKDSFIGHLHRPAPCGHCVAEWEPLWINRYID